MGAWKRFGGGLVGVVAASFVAAFAPSCDGDGTGQGGNAGTGGAPTTTSTTAPTGGGGAGGTGGGCGDLQQTAGDCKVNVCDDGDVQSVPDDTDLPDDGAECTVDTCDAGEPVSTPAAPGTACARNGGKVCDGDGACVACLETTDCDAGQVCSRAHECVPATCDDGVKTGDETDIDCGGACGATCVPGQACDGAADCLQGVCAQNTCLVPTCADGVQNGSETDVDCGGSCASGFNPKKCDPDEGCNVDSDCKGNQCSGTTCVPNCADGVLNNGESAIDCGGPSCAGCGDGDTCALDGDCSSDHCAAGICCDTACDAECSACSAAGKVSGPDGVCGPAKAGHPCGPAPECANGEQTAQDTCDGAGTCADGGFTPCSPYVCDVATCKTSCAGDGDCAAPATCAGGSCLLPDGEPCALGSACASGTCADGVCCDSACAGLCQACTAAKKGGGADGACGDVLTGTDPDAECAGLLNCGAGKCQIANGQPCAEGAECVSGNCADGVCCNGPCTATCQACSAAKKGGGSDGTCGNIAINNDPDDECSGAAACNGSGACALSVNGTPCATGAECSSGNCADGVCCNTACNGSCLACTAAKKGSGLNGLCGPIATGTDPDSECSGGTVCATGGCKLPDAAPCASAASCISGYCADGVCCSSNCIGTCQACTAAKKGSGADGVCGNIASGTDPDSECGGPTTCSGAGACALQPIGSTCALGVECQSGFCADGVCCDTACGGTCQACTTAKKGAGTDGTCGSIAATTDPDSECPGAAACNGATACALLANGASCSVSSECTSGFCADGVCCNSACTSTCQACTAAKKGQGADGTCGSILVGQDPDSECPGAAACSGSTSCSLLGSGAACAQGPECSSGFCVDGVCCSTVCTSPCQACTAAKKGAGSDGSCGNIASGTDPDSECAGVQICNGSGACRLPNGEACSAATDCLSGFCADGVCCNVACTGACQACTTAKKGSGADGTCSTIAAGTDPDSECGGAANCNGAGACALFANGAACAMGSECSSGNCADGVCCNTACNTSCQACTAAKKGTGSDGTCGSIVSGADPDSECPGTAICNGSGACKIPTGDACLLAADCLSGFCADGVCCSAACTGTCQACTAAKKGGGADGVCGNIQASTDPDSECFGMYSCNGSGACALLANGALCASNSECTSGFCADGVCCNSACNTLCNACTGAKKGSGADGTCGAIGANLDPDAECAGVLACNGASLCKLPLGEACLVNTDCVSNACVDGVCCNTTCTGSCQACSAAKKGSGADGACGPIAVGTDPDSECFGAITCNGASACGTQANGTTCAAGGECASGNCVDGVCCNTACNTLCNACTAVKKGSGADGTCGAILANQDPENECAGNLVCNGASACRLPNGEACLLGADCVSNACVDGVCCNTTCTATCNACTAAKKGSGADGVCGTIAAGDDPDNECSGMFSCNGASACALLANGAACALGGECTSGNCVDGVCCNTSCANLCNACTAVKKNSGADGTCGVIAAATDPDAECPGATLCSGSSSCALFTNGAACSIDAECSSGNCVDGVCCNTACDGLCEACIGAKTMVSNGTCAAVVPGTDPDDECSDLTSSPNCGGVLMCGP